MGALVSKWDGLRWAVTTQLATHVLRWKGVKVGNTARFLGMPIVSGTDLGSVHICDGVVLISDSRGTALGVRSPTILRCLTAAAAIEIGNDSGLSGTVICAATSVTIGKRCLFGADCMIFDTDFHNYEANNRRFSSPQWSEISAPVYIGNDVFLGTRTIVCKGVTIGHGSIIGAGSIVISDIPAMSVAAGVPARVVGQVPNGVVRDSSQIA